MKLNDLQAALKSKQAEYQAVETEAGDKPMTEEQVKKYEGLVKEANVLAGQIDAAIAAKKISDMGKEPDGRAYSPATFNRGLTAGEGTFPGLSQTEKGELFAIDGAFKGLGEQKLAELQHGSYKDAFANYIRYGQRGMTKEDKAILNRGSDVIMEGKASQDRAMKILEEGSDIQGGFWIPPAFNPELVKKMAPMATARPNSKVYQTGSDHLTFPAVQYNGSTADDTYANIFTSGVRFSFRSSIGSTSDFSEATNPVSGQINIPVQLATCTIILMREQLEDNAFDILGYINDLGAEAFALGEEYYFTNGTGAGQPRGFTKHPANVCSTGSVIQYSTYNTVAGTTYWGNVVLSGTTTIAWGSATSGIIGAEAQLPPQYESNAKWFASKNTYAAIRAINAGTATLPQWSLGDSWPNYSNGYRMSLLGYEAVKNQFMGTGVTTGQPYLMLGDLNGYYIVDRVGLSVEVFREVYGLRDQVVVYMRKRTGGDLVQYWRTKMVTST